MLPISKAAGVAVLALGSARWQVVAQQSVESCADLITVIEASPSVASFTLAGDTTCPSHITIAASQSVTINGASHTMAIATDFLSSSSSSTQSLFEVEEGGTLTLKEISFVHAIESGLADEGVRAIHSKGTLTVVGCVFDELNTNALEHVTKGGAIYTESDGQEVNISGSQFLSNFATERGGAICAAGTDIVSITESSFEGNGAGPGGEEAGAGGDVYAGSGVALSVTSCNFTSSTAEYGGAAIECCGAGITRSTFVDTVSFSESEHFGAVLVGRRGQTECPFALVLTDCVFTGCAVDSTTGAGGALAVFDTSASIEGCSFDANRGTAVLFESSSVTGRHQLWVVRSLFTQNTDAADEFADSGEDQASAMMLRNTGVAEGGQPVPMAQYNNIFCFANDPYKCELVHDLADFAFSGQSKCNLCTPEGTRVPSATSSDEVLESGSSSSGSWSTQDYLIAALGAALALLVVLVIDLAVEQRCRKRGGAPSAEAASETRGQPERAEPEAGATTEHTAQSGTGTGGSAGPAVQSGAATRGATQAAAPSGAEPSGPAELAVQSRAATGGTTQAAAPSETETGGEAGPAAQSEFKATGTTQAAVLPDSESGGGTEPAAPSGAEPSGPTELVAQSEPVTRGTAVPAAQLGAEIEGPAGPAAQSEPATRGTTQAAARSDS